MEENSRIDYFRSEIKGDMERLKNQILLQQAEQLRLLRDFEKRLEKLTVEIKNLEMSVR